MQAAFRLRVDRPTGGDGEASLHQPFRQCIPRARGLVGEHERHDAVRLQHAAALGEDGGHALLIITPGQRLGAFLVRELGRIGDRFVFLVRERTAKQFRQHLPGGAFEPDVKEIRQLRIHHVVVVRWVHHDAIHAAVGNVVE